MEVSDGPSGGCSVPVALCGAARPPAGCQGVVSLAGIVAFAAVRDGGRCRRFRRADAVGRGASGVLAAVPAVRARHPEPRHAVRGDRRHHPDLFRTCFTDWVERLRMATAETAGPGTIAIDGKTSRRSHARPKGRGPLHTVSAWATRQQLVLGQEAVSGKSNEIVAIPLLLQRLELAGAIVTIDAMGTQTQIAQTILDGGGDYVLALKQNRPATFTEVKALFAKPPPSLVIGMHQTIDGGHGRIETRTHRVCHDVSWLFSDRRYPGEPAFPGLAMVGMVESRTERQTRARAAILPLLGQARRRDVRPCGTQPLGDREPAPLGARRGVPRRPRTPAHRPRTSQHGRGQAHGAQPAQTGQAHCQLEKPQETGRLEHRLPRSRHPAVSMTVHSIPLPAASAAIDVHA